MGARGTAEGGSALVGLGAPLLRRCTLDPPAHTACTVRRRAKATAAACDAFAAAFSTARGGFVRDSLVAGYPRLAGLLEAVVARAQRDSAARDVGPALDDGQVGCWGAGLEARRG